MTIWKVNRDSLETLVKKALYKLDRPSSRIEVLTEIQKIRPEVKIQSINATIGRICLLVNKDKYILPGWKDRYSNLNYAPRKQRVNTHKPEHHRILREKIVDLIKYSQLKSMRSNIIIKIITEANPKVKKSILYNIMEDERYFSKSRDENNKVLIRLNPLLSNGQE